jgi:phosphohistidine phosphatase
LELVLSAANLEVSPRFEPAIYEGGPSALLELIAQIEDGSESLLIVGHNPTLEDLQKALTGQPAHFSPGTLAEVVFEIERWGDLEVAQGRLSRLVNPKDL